MIGTVILTRTEADNQRVAPLFERYGFTVVSGPTIELRPLAVDLTQGRRALEKGGGVVLTSGEATERWLDLRRDRLADLPVECYLVVGRRSAELLHAGDPETPIVAVADSSAELLQSLESFPVRLLYPGSRARRDEFVSGLRVRGSQVFDFPLYEPVLPADGGRSFSAALRAATLPLAVVFFSPSAVEGMQALAITLPTGAIVAAIGATTAAALNARGITHVVVPERPDPELLAQALMKRFVGSDG